VRPPQHDAPSKVCFFKTIGGCRQIGCIHDRQRPPDRVQLCQQWCQQLCVDPAQQTQIQTIPKMGEHFGVGQNPLIGQTRELSPRPIFRQESQQQIKRMCWSQQTQEQHPK